MSDEKKRDFLATAIHPFLFTLYPILDLASKNANEIRITDPFRSIVISIIGTVLVFIISYSFSRNWRRAALMTSWIVIIFFAYGHVYLSIKNITISDYTIGRHRFLLPFSAALAAIGGLVIFRYRYDEIRVTRVVNVIGLMTILIPVISLSSFWMRSGSTFITGNLTVLDNRNEVPNIGIGPNPDIYYIILDGYGRSDILEKYFDTQNEDFIEFLEERGFYVARNSAANYAHTALSLASSLNMNYLEDIQVNLKDGEYPSTFLGRMKNSFVRTALEDIGYNTISLDSGWKYTQWDDADYYLDHTSNGNLDHKTRIVLKPFEDLMLNVSAGRAILDFIISTKILDIEEPSYNHADLVLAQLSDLQAVAELPGPRFVFAHIISPHRPYVFGQNGERVDRGGYFTLADTGNATHEGQEESAYINQLIFITTQIEDVVDEIISNSEIQPIIIIQSDHGPSMDVVWADPGVKDIEQRMPILNVYLLPESCRPTIYGAISPVNTFRVVFNCAFNTDYEILPDESYFSGFNSIYDFQNVDEILQELDS
jgi:hypothetical protein